FHLVSFRAPTYGFLVALGVFVGLWISVKFSERQGINGDHAWNFGITMVLAGILGSKALYILVDWHYYAANPREIFSWDTMQAGRFFRRPACRICGGCLVYPSLSSSRAADV